MFVLVQLHPEAHALLANATREAVETKRPLRELLGALVGAFLTPEQIEGIDRPEDYLGAAEHFRKQLLED